MKLLIADSGATKTDWAYIEDGKPVFVRSAGLHPAYFEPESMIKKLKPVIGHFTPGLILFYGAGCYTEESAGPVLQLLKQIFEEVPIEINDDLAAAAHAFLEDRKGIAAILGTGSASGYFSGGVPEKKVASLGYILGDEGSAADIGKRILRRYLRDLFTKRTQAYLEERIGKQEYGRFIQQLYHEKRPSYFLAQITQSVLSEDSPEEINLVVENSFRAFVEAHLKNYEGYSELPLVFSGGVAVHARKQLEYVLKEYQVKEFDIVSGVISKLAERQIEKMK